MGTKNAAICMRLHAAIKFERCKDMYFHRNAKINSEKFCDCVANCYFCSVIQMKYIMGKTVSKKISKGGFVDVKPFTGMDGRIPRSPKRGFILTSVSKKELDDRRVPVYPYIM